MSAVGGPNVVDDGLVLALDAANIKSFKGGPATNLLPNAAANGRFTTSNGWGTYNTNQYNNNQYFSIGTISSITDNIVNTSANHPLRTYDVVRPQTTGGGVTAGVDYFVNKISNTSFSLHQYNSSQDGSQGYINPSTGVHKVYDSIALDERILIDSASFPTMWWGAPHLPNSGIVKEVVEGGGYVPDTNSMRIHTTRNVASLEGMAYNVVTPVSQSDSVTVSYWARTNSYGAANSVAIDYRAYFGPVGGWIDPATPTLTEDWQLITHQFTAPATYSFVQYFFPPVKSLPYWVEIADLMVETGSAPSTTVFFTAGTRGTTVATGGGWADRSGNGNHGSFVNNVNSNFLSNEVYLDGTGTNDGVVQGANVQLSESITDIRNYNEGCTYSFWLKVDPSANDRLALLYGSGTIRHVEIYSVGKYFRTEAALQNGYSFGSSVFPYEVRGIWAKFDIVFATNESGRPVRWYQNGTLFDTRTLDGGNFPGTEYFSFSAIGRSTGNTQFLYATSFHGSLSSFFIYSKALTAAEILQNYNATKGRFGL